MTFLHKLSSRLARLKALLVLSLAVLSCEQPLRITGGSSSRVTRIAVTPRDVTLFPNQTTDITAVGFTAARETGKGVAADWSRARGDHVGQSHNRRAAARRRKPREPA